MVLWWLRSQKESLALAVLAALAQVMHASSGSSSSSPALRNSGAVLVHAHAWPRWESARLAMHDEEADWFVVQGHAPAGFHATTMLIESPIPGEESKPSLAGR